MVPPPERPQKTSQTTSFTLLTAHWPVNFSKPSSRSLLCNLRLNTPTKFAVRLLLWPSPLIP